MGVKAAQQTQAAPMIDQLLAQEDDSKRREFVLHHLSIDWEAIVTILTDRVREQVHVSPPRAEKLADVAILVAGAINSKLAMARSQRAKANTLYALDDHAAAVEMHQRAAALFEEVDQRTELARTLSGSIQPLLLLGRYDEALSAGERARAIFTAQANTWRLARLEINIGNLHQRQDRFAQALTHYERAYPELLTRDDVEGLAAVLSNLSLCYISLNDFPKALEFHRKAREHCQAKGMPILVAYADYNIAYLYFLRGEYGRAIHMLRDAETGAKAAGDLYQLALCDLDLSEIYLEVNLASEAGELARAAHDGFGRLGFGYESAKALAFAAIAASRQGQAFQGLKLFAQARDMFVRDKNQVWPSLIDLYKALVLFHEGRLFEARQLAISAAEFFGASSMARKAALADLLLARIALRMHDTSAALEHTQAARKRLVPLESPSLLFQTEYLFGEIGRAGGDSEQAYLAYARARDALETLRGGLRGEELKIAFFDNKLEVYEHLVDLCLDRPGGLEEAFGHIEQAKSRSLMDRLVQPVHVPTEADTGQSELVRSIRNLREELNWYYNLIEREQLRPEENSENRIRNLEQEARSREAALMRALEQATLTEVSQAGLEVPTHVSLGEIRSALPADTVLIEYFCLQERILACILSANDLKVFPVTLQSRVQKRLQLLQFQLSKFRLDPQYVKTFEESLLAATTAHLRDLYEELVAPAAGAFSGAKHLVFVPHGLVHYVPIHALHDGDSYLVDRFSISYAPSASIYSICQGRTGNEQGDALIMGIADAQAPAILDEVAALEAILPRPRVFRGEEATAEVLARHGPVSRIVHIATHGYFRQDNPMFSSIRLGGSYLSLYDLYHLQLPAELIVLSGCATGLNVIRPGDEQIGLVRGLLQAGAQSLILSLWDVHDSCTKEFMVAFYTHFKAGLPKPLALQAAMVELRERYPHPYYWAPFLLIGKT